MFLELHLVEMFIQANVSNVNTQNFFSGYEDTQWKINLSEEFN